MSDPFHAVRADRAVVETAATHLRATAIRDGYAGHDGKHVTFALALLLDEVARHVSDLPPELRAAVVQVCRAMVSPDTP